MEGSAAAEEEEAADVNVEQVRALAATLAPQERELKELMDDPLLYSNSHSQQEDDEISSQADDDMDHELEQLTYSEDILRRELDLAKDFASFFGSSSFDQNPFSSNNNMLATPTALFESPLPHAYAEVYSPVEEEEGQNENSDKIDASVQQDEADMEQDDNMNEEDDEERTEDVQSQDFDTDSTNSPIHQTSSEEVANASAPQEKKQYFTPSPPRKDHSRISLAPTPADTPDKSVVLFRSPGKVYSSSEHFQRLKLNKEPQGAWYSVDLTRYVVDGLSSSSDDDESPENANTGTYPPYVGMGIKEYCLSISEWKHLFVGLRQEDDELQKQQQSQQNQPEQANPLEQQQPHQTPEKSSQSAPATASKVAPVRTISIRIRPDVLCGAVMDAVTQTLANCPHSSIIKRQGGHLQGTVRGHLPPQSNRASRRSSSRTNISNEPEQRECTFLVDVQLCTHKSPQCERVLLIRVYHWKEEQAGASEDDLWSPSSAATTNAMNTTIDSDDYSSATFSQGDSFLNLEESADQGQQANVHVREACALIQRVESPELARKIRPLSQKGNAGSSRDNEGLREVVSGHLLQNYRACPSVLQPDTAITLPALSPEDWPIIQSSWNWVKSVWDELETRELTYLTLVGFPVAATDPSLEAEGIDEAGDDVAADGDFASTAPYKPRFGGFPALPTLDVQYCSQLRRLSREAMIGQLLKAASVLEEYARQAEYQCANLIDLLRPTFVLYGVEPPSLPKPAPLAAYPLEYTPPQALCPPWGTKVMEALNQVAAMTHEAVSESETDTDRLAQEDPTNPTGPDKVGAYDLESVELAETAVQMVYEAFQKQDDEEQSARLARKNLQVMDRLSKMEDHHRASIRALEDSTTQATIAAADDFLAEAENSVIGLNGIVVEGEEGEPICATPWREVPLLKWNIGVGGSSGTCTITAHQIIFTPAKYIPLVSRSQSIWFCLRDVEFQVTQSQGTLLNPLSTMQVLHRDSGKEAHSFRPASPASRLKSFLDILTKGATGGVGI